MGTRATRRAARRARVAAAMGGQTALDASASQSHDPIRPTTPPPTGSPLLAHRVAQAAPRQAPRQAPRRAGDAPDTWGRRPPERGEPSEPYVRDAVTGERVTLATLAGRHVMRVSPRDIREERHPLDGGLLALTPVPPVIDSREQYPEGHLGGRKWTRPFTRYIANVLPLSVAQERDDWRYWWRVPYVVERLHVRMGAQRFAVAMARIASGMRLEVVERGGFVYDANIAGTRVSIPFRRREREWVLGCERQARRLVRTVYFPYDRRPHQAVRRIVNG